MKKKLSVAVFSGYTILVAIVSLKPGGGGGFLVEPYDKLAHLLTYAVFATLAWRLRLLPRHFFYLCIAIVVYGGLLELGQSFVPNRSMSGLDLLANTMGVLLGALFSARLYSSPGSMDTR